MLRHCAYIVTIRASLVLRCIWQKTKRGARRTNLGRR